MSSTPQIRVTLSDDLLIHLRKEAEKQHVPLQWLVAGLVCDTIESRNAGVPAHRVPVATY
jgi:hypothetical protein